MSRPNTLYNTPHNSPGMGGGGSLGGSPPLHTIVPICTSSSTSYLVTRVPRPIMDTRIKHKLLSRVLIIGNPLRASAEELKGFLFFVSVGRTQYCPNFEPFGFYHSQQVTQEMRHIICDLLDLIRETEKDDLLQESCPLGY